MGLLFYFQCCLVLAPSSLYQYLPSLHYALQPPTRLPPFIFVDYLSPKLRCYTAYQTLTRALPTCAHLSSHLPSTTYSSLPSYQHYPFNLHSGSFLCSALHSTNNSAFNKLQCNTPWHPIWRIFYLYTCHIPPSYLGSPSDANPHTYSTTHCIHLLRTWFISITR